MPPRDALMLRVRELSVSEGQALSRLVRRTRDVTVMKRAMVVLHSHQGFSPPKIAQMVWWSEDWVRRIIKDFNRMGRDALYPRKAPGAPPTFTREHRQAIVDLALSSPRDHGMPIQTWSLERLRDAAIHEGIVEHIGKETVRQILHEEAASFQAVKTWKESYDPKFKEKLKRIRELTDRRHNPPIVVAADEMGPISLRPYGGRAWASKGRPVRIRATYTRTQGVRFLMGAYDFLPRPNVRVDEPPEARRGLGEAPAIHPLEVPRRRADLPHPGQPQRPHDAQVSGGGRAPRHRVRAHPDERVPPEPDRDALRQAQGPGPHGERLPRLADPEEVAAGRDPMAERAPVGRPEKGQTTLVVTALVLSWTELESVWRANCHVECLGPFSPAPGLGLLLLVFGPVLVVGANLRRKTSVSTTASTISP